MRTFICTNFDGHWPVPVAAVVSDFTKQDAEARLLTELEGRGLFQSDPITLSEIVIDEPATYILSDGDY